MGNCCRKINERMFSNANMRLKNNIWHHYTTGSHLYMWPNDSRGMHQNRRSKSNLPKLASKMSSDLWIANGNNYNICPWVGIEQKFILVSYTKSFRVKSQSIIGDKTSMHIAFALESANY